MSFIIFDKNIEYPSNEYYFSPSEKYPEYNFGHISKNPNNVYGAVRKCLINAGLDKENYGKSNWNPLSSLISKGNNVFVLCNFVYHKKNDETEEEFFAKCTHGSVIRAVTDYILLAVGENGSVSFGNSPLQSCDWDKVLQDTRANKIVEFYNKYKNKNFKVSAVDLRLYKTVRDNLGRILSINDEKENGLNINIDIGKDSLLEVLYNDNKKPEFRVSDYNSQDIMECHDIGKHIYMLNKKILESNVIVSIPKLKTHEKVGITCGLKGCVGAITYKKCLVHHRFGSLKTGGDEYLENFFLLKWFSIFHDYVNKKSIGLFENILHICDKMFWKFSRIIGINVFGSWYGNDSAWRMTLDIARILRYSTVSGELKNEPQRKHMLFTDGIIAGDGNGPLSPNPVKSGILNFCDDIVIGDYVSSLIMGFNPDKIKMIKEAFRMNKYNLTEKLPKDIIVKVNGELIPLNKLNSHLKLKFIPPKGWKNHIEL